jgi:hypothetical protein
MAGRGPKNSRWGGGIITDSEGYLKVLAGKEHPLADARGYVALHHLIWNTSGRRPRRRGEIIHHVDEQRANFALGNLRRKKERRHLIEHAKSQPRDRRGRFNRKRRRR